jgi:hypothetical protein
MPVTLQNKIFRWCTDSQSKWEARLLVYSYISIHYIFIIVLPQKTVVAQHDYSCHGHLAHL